MAAPERRLRALPIAGYINLLRAIPASPAAAPDRPAAPAQSINTPASRTAAREKRIRTQLTAGYIRPSKSSTKSSTSYSSKSSYSSSYSSSKKSYKTYDSYDDGYDAIYDDDDYDEDRYDSDPDYAAGVDDAMDELDW